MIVYLPSDPFKILISKVFSTMLRTQLGLSHPLALGLSHYIRGQPLGLIGIHPLCCAHGQLPMMQCKMPLCLSRRMRISFLHEQTHIHLSPTLQFTH
jgi:hypothetical protein